MFLGSSVRWIRQCCIPTGLALLTTAATGGPVVAADEQPPARTPAQQVELGRELFLHDWSTGFPAVIPASEQSNRRNGLGPMYNDVSCVACHSQGGVGGAGPVQKNADVLSVYQPGGTSPNGRTTFSERAQRLHPGFSQFATSVALHKFGWQSQDGVEDYKTWRSKLVTRGDKKPLDQQHPTRDVGPVRLHLTQRNTPALFGAGLIDSIPAEVLVAAAKEQHEKFPSISGRVAQSATGKIGRFGWRGQTTSLHDFVLSACAAELGLQVPGQTEAQYPQHLMKTNSVEVPVRDAVDLTNDECLALTAFVASLPTPRVTVDPVPSLIASRDDSAALFESVGCAACHMPKLGDVSGIYSDLLLHDMGRELADPLPAFAETEFVINAGSTYYGPTAVPLDLASLKTNIQQEWRTPPLWGVRDSAPYLHDGRANSLAEAIAWHGGEAAESVRAFRNLKQSEQNQLIAFLSTLAAPANTEPATR